MFFGVTRLAFGIPHVGAGSAIPGPDHPECPFVTHHEASSREHAEGEEHPDGETSER